MNEARMHRALEREMRRDKEEGDRMKRTSRQQGRNRGRMSKKGQVGRSENRKKQGAKTRGPGAGGKVNTTTRGQRGPRSETEGKKKGHAEQEKAAGRGRARAKKDRGKVDRRTSGQEGRGNK